MTNRINKFIPDDGLIFELDNRSYSDDSFPDLSDGLRFSNPCKGPETLYWKIMLVDDDIGVQEMTKKLLNELKFAGKSLNFISAYSGEEAKGLMAEHPDTAIVLLDLAMETKDAGLRVAKYIREELKNKTVRIFLQRSECEAELEESVLVNNDINEDYLKEELTKKKLSNKMIAGLKLYRDAIGLERERQELAKKSESLNIFSRNIERLVKRRTQKLSENNWQLQQEIRKRQQIESELRKSEERWQLVRGSTGDGIWDWDLQTGEVFYCQRWKEMLGYGQREIANHINEWMRRVHPEDMGRVMDAFGLRLNSYSSEASATTPYIVVEYRMRCQDGSYKWILLRGQAIWDLSGKPIRIVGSITDISDRKRVEERLQLALEGSDLGLWDWNITTNEIYLSPQWKQMLGYEVGEIEDSVSFWERLLHPEDLPVAWEDIGVHLDGETPFFKVEFRMLTKSGEWKWIESHGKVCDRDSEGNPLRMTGTHKDITDRKLAEAAISESEEKYRHLVETSQDMIWSVDGRGYFTFVNQAVKQIYGYEPEEMIGRPFTDFQPPAEQAKDLKTFQCILAGESLFQYETLHLAKDGGPINMVFNAIGLYDREGNVIGATGTASNITARKQAESELQQAKVAAEAANQAKSQFLANMSHEIRTPMNGVLGMTELLLSTSLNSQQLDFVQTIKASGDNLLAIINDILDFSKLEAGEMLVDSHEFNLGFSLENVVDLLAYQANCKGLELVLLIEGSVPRQVLGDELRLRQIITNLVGNAIKFTESGSVTIEVAAENYDNSLTTSKVPVDIDKIDELAMGDRALSLELLQIFMEDAPSYLKNMKGAIAASDAVAVANNAHQIKGASATVAIDSMSSIAAQLEAEAKSNRLSSAIELVDQLEIILEQVNGFVDRLLWGENNSEVPKETENSLTTSKVPVDRERLHQLSRGDTEFELELLQTFMDDAPACVENVKEAIAASDSVTVANNAHQLKGASATVAIDSMSSIAAQLEAEAQSNRLSSAMELVAQLEIILEQVKTFVAQLLSGGENRDALPESLVPSNQTTNNVTKLRFAVKDTGIGISPAQQKKLFQPFSQVDASTTRKYGGTGLGLAICKQLVEMMGGEIGIDSEMGVGSTFWFTAIFGQVGWTLAPDPALTGKKLLVVDDNPIICQAVGQLALLWGMVCESVPVTDALAHLCSTAEGKAYDVVILDMQVAKIGEIIGQLKQECPQTKLIVMTSLERTNTASEFLDLGCDDYLVKPVRESRLLETLQGVLSSGTDPDSRVSRPVISTDDRLLRHYGKILLVEDTPVNQKVVLNQLQRLGYQADCVQNGRECLDKLTETNYDILLMDCQMPVLDGYQTTQALRQLEGTERHTVVIGLTANAMKGDREKCLAAGMDDYLSKPVMLSELSGILQKYCC